MSDLIPTLRAVIREELMRLRPPEFGIVTGVFPHDSGSSDNNHQLNVRLRASGLELQRVPMAVPRLGLSALPRVGELVLVVFAGGDINTPVAVGSVYDSDHHPPQAMAPEVVYVPADAGDASMRRVYVELPSGARLRFDDDKLELESGGTVVTIERDGDVTVKSAGKINIEAQGDIVLKAAGNLQLEAQQNVTVKAMTATVEGQVEAKLKGAQVTLAGLTNFSPS